MRPKSAAVLVSAFFVAATPAAESERAMPATLRATAIAAGLAHSCALASAGGVKCWGYNGHDELGTGRGDSESGSSTPVNVSGLQAGVVAITAGVRHSCAITVAGGVECWGDNASGQLGDGTVSRRFAPVDVVGLTGGVTAVTAGLDHTCALTRAGGVECWGLNRFGELGDGTTTDRLSPVGVIGLASGATAIAAAGFRTCALTASGGVKCWGGATEDYWTPADVPGLTTGVRAISGRCVLTSVGGVRCWNADVFTGSTPVDLSGLRGGVTAIATGSAHACALTSAGGAVCWGLNDHGQVGDGTTGNRTTPVAVTGLSSGVTAIAAGSFHTCALVRTGGIRCWGADESGQLGDGATNDRSKPVGVIGFGTAKPTLALVSRSVVVTPARVAPITLRCGPQARCDGTVTLTATVGGKLVHSSARRVQVKLGGRAYSIAAGRTWTIKVKLTGGGFRLLVRTKRLPTRIRISLGQPAGGTTTSTRTLALEAPRVGMG